MPSRGPAQTPAPPDPPADLSEPESTPPPPEIPPGKAVPLPYPATPMLGLLVALPPGDAAVQVVRVVPGGPAEAAGILLGDRLRSLDGESIASPLELVQLLRKKHAGDRVVLGIQRDGQEQTHTVTLASRDLPPPPAEPQVESAVPSARDSSQAAPPKPQGGKATPPEALRDAMEGEPMPHGLFPSIDDVSRFVEEEQKSADPRYDELLRRYDDLRREVDALKRELLELRQQVPPPAPAQP